MRELVVLCALCDEVKAIQNLGKEVGTLLSGVFEDNNACRKVASSTMPKMTPRSKNIAVKYHWFCKKLDELNIKILRIDMKLKLADIFTKGLTPKEFAIKRELVCGW